MCKDKFSFLIKISEKNMAIKYVNKSGSDANDGSTAALAKLTIQAMATAAATGDTIIVGSGSYNEKVSAWGAKTITFYADGVVIMDGSGLGNGAVFSSTAGYPVSLQPYTTGGQWIIQNHLATTYLIAGNGSTSISLNNVICLSNGSPTCLSPAAISVTNCVFSGFDRVIVNGNNSTYCFQCTFYGKGTNIAVVVSHSNTLLTLAQCIISNFGTAYSTGGVPVYANDNLFYSITNWSIAGVTYTTLPQVQAAGWDSRSAVENPNFTALSNNIFYIKSVSTVSPYVGAYPYGLTRGGANNPDSKWIITGTADNSGWYNPDGNVLKNETSNFFELAVGNVGVIWSPVYDLTGTSTFSKINLATTQYWPTNVVDTTISDVRPNAQTMEVRASNSTYNQADESPSWSEVRYNGALATPITGRYLQFRITMRNNGVQA